MCLDIDYDDETKFWTEETPRARKKHDCDECAREIAPGETYKKWKFLSYDCWTTQRMCAHCWATIELGAVIAHCPKVFYWDEVHGLDPDDGAFVGDILANHDLSFAERFRMLRRVAERKRQWHRPDGSLYPLPKIPVRA